MKKKREKEAKTRTNNLFELIDGIVAENEKLKKENTELRFQNESLILENRSQKKTGERYYEAAVLIAKRAKELREENIKLKVDLDVLSKRGVYKDVIQN